MPARDSILALVCGYPARVRENMALSMYRTFCDESGRGEAAFVVGGLSAKVDRWLAFSDRWQAVLDAEPSLLHFHHSQRQGLTKEQHQAKIEALIPVVNEFVERGDLIVVDVAEYKAVYRNKVGVTYDQPFHIGYVSIFMQAAAHIADPSAKVDFVFDDVDDTALVELREAHREFSAICPAAEVKKRFGALPVTGNDEELPPLQAADLWSGIMRRAYRDRDPLAIRNLERFTIPNRCSLLDQEKITKLWDMLTGHVKKRGLDEIPYEDGPARSKRLAQAKKELARLRREGMLRLDSDPPDDPL